MKPLPPVINAFFMLMILPQDAKNTKIRKGQFHAILGLFYKRHENTVFVRQDLRGFRIFPCVFLVLTGGLHQPLFDRPEVIGKSRCHCRRTFSLLPIATGRPKYINTLPHLQEDIRSLVDPHTCR